MTENVFMGRLKDSIAKSKEAIEKAEVEIEKAESAGIDMSEERAKLEAEKDKLAMIESVYLTKKK